MTTSISPTTGKEQASSVEKRPVFLSEARLISPAATVVGAAQKTASTELRLMEPRKVEVEALAFMGMRAWSPRVRSKIANRMNVKSLALEKIVKLK